MRKIIYSSIIGFLSLFSASASNVFLKMDRESVVVVPLSEMDSIVHGEIIASEYNKKQPVFGEKDTCMGAKFYRNGSLFMACDKDYLSSLLFSDEMNGGVASKSVCKSTQVDPSEPNDTAYAYHYNPETKDLFLYVYDQYLDCCHEVLTSESKVMDDSIYIGVHGYCSEIADYYLFPLKFLKDCACNCICPYDVVYKVAGVDAKKYSVRLHFDEYVIDLTQGYDGFGLKQDMIEGYYVESSDCKSESNLDMLSDGLADSFMENNAYDDTLVSYKYDSISNTCYVVSHDRSFNCCPSLFSSVSFLKDTVFVASSDTNMGAPCNCICKFDVTTRLSGFKGKIYHFNVDGTIFDVDFSQQTDGFVLKDTTPKAVSLKQSACKRDISDEPETRGVSDESLSDTLISYYYNPQVGELEIISYNQELNCCVEASSELQVEGNVIYLKSVQTDLGCRCKCLYDVSTKISKIRRQKYHFVVDGVSFDVDFSEQNVGVVLK